MSERRLPGERLTDVISWAETEVESRKKSPQAYSSERAMYLWFYAAAVLDLRDDVQEALRLLEAARRANERQGEQIAGMVHSEAAQRSATLPPADVRLIPNEEWEKVAYILHWADSMLNSKDEAEEFTAVTHITQGLADLKRILGRDPGKPLSRADGSRA